MTDPTIMHSRTDDVVSFSHGKELVLNSGLPASASVKIGTDHGLADLEPLAASFCCIRFVYPIVSDFRHKTAKRRKSRSSQLLDV